MEAMKEQEALDKLKDQAIVVREALNTLDGIERECADLGIKLYWNNNVGYSFSELATEIVLIKAHIGMSLSVD